MTPSKDSPARSASLLEAKRGRLSSAELEDPRLVAALEEYLAAAEAGSPPDREAFLARHADIAAPLALCLDGLDAFAGVPHAESVGATGREVAGTLGDFRIVREVGRGGMGIVYEAEQISLGRRVALKVLPFAATMGPRQLQRFHNEARAAAGLHHEHIVPVYAVGCDRGVHVYAMQFIEGQTLAGLLGRPSVASPPPAEGGNETVTVAAAPTEHAPRDAAFFRRVAEWGVQAAEALEHAHALGIVHRDVKPDNLMIDAQGKLWVTDFGLARTGADAGLTLTGDMVGTLRYMSPEQALAKHDVVDHRSDVYGLGVTLYELLTRRPAVDGQDREELLRRIAFEEPTAPRQLERAIPVELETVLLKTMAKNPAERYDTAQEMAEDLERFLGDEPVRARRPTLGQRARKWARRHQGVMRVAGVALALIVAALAVSAGLVWREKNEKQRAYEAEAAQRREADKKRRQARKAVDEMFTRVAREWLDHEPQLEEVQRDFLLQALQFYEEFAREQGDDPETIEYRANAHLNAAGIHFKFGQHEKAEGAYRQAIALFQKLAENPDRGASGELGWARSLGNLGALFATAARTREAEDAHREAIRLKKKLLERFPRSAEHRESLAISRYNLAVLLKESGRGGEAEPLLTEALSAFKDLTAEVPGSRSCPRSLAGAQCLLADLFFEKGRGKEGEDLLRQAVALMEPLAVPSARAPACREQLAVAQGNLGAFFARSGRPRDAEPALREAVRVMDALVEDFPRVASYRRFLYSFCCNLGLLQKSTGRPEDAEKTFRRAVAALQPLVRTEPGALIVQEQLADAYRRLGEVLGALRRPEVVQVRRQEVEVRQATADRFPDEPKCRQELARALYHLALDLDRANDAPQAEEVLRRGIDVVTKLVEAYPNSREYRNDLSQLHNPLGRIVYGLGRPKESVELFRRAIKLNPENKGARGNLAWILASHPNADIRDAPLAVELARKAVEQDKGDGNLWNTLGVAEHRAGNGRAALAALEKSMQLRKGGDAGDFFFLAMTHWQLGDKEQARRWYDKAVQWMDQHNPRGEELRRFRAEAAALLGVKEPPPKQQAPAPGK